MKLIILIALVSCGFARSLFNSQLDDEWTLYKKIHNKNYAHAREEIERRQTWEKNVDLVAKHNLEFDLGIHTFTLGINEYADMTNDEFVAKLNGFHGNKTKSGIHFLAPSNIGDLPSTVDWRDKGYVTKVKNQGQCGSCWSFSATGSLEGQHFKSTGTLVSLSEQNLMDCSKPEGNKGCQGGLMDAAFTYIKKNGGIDTEVSYPYKAKNGRCHYDSSNKGATDTGFVDIDESEDALQQAVATVGPISVAIDASHSSFQLYRSGVYNERKCSSSKLDHGVLAVGYGTDGMTDYWLVKNSWGQTWGMEGYIKMSRNHNNQCGIATSASYPTV